MITEKKQTDLPNNRSRFQKKLNRQFAMVSRWMHIYVSMLSFAIVLFFAITGITLNHPDKFAYQQTTKQFKGNLPLEWVNRLDTTKINKLAIVEFFRNKFQVKSPVSDFRIEDNQCSISFKGPGYAADAFVSRESGNYELSIVSAGFVGLINDLHKGRDTGSKWAWVIDVSAIFMIIVSLTGLILLLYIKKKKWYGLVVALAGFILFYLIYIAFIQ